MIKTKQKLTYFIAEYLWSIGVRNVFGVTGGASLHLLEAFEQVGNFKIVYNHHEQASAMCADAVWRLKQELSVCVATSGPGAMNLISGIASSFFDSVPMLCLTGQVASFRSNEGLNVRQVGFQETNIVDMVGPITKHAKKISSVKETLEDLQKAVSIAYSGRKGPVLIDIPDDFQRTMISENEINPIKKTENNFIKTSLPIEPLQSRRLEEIYLAKRMIIESQKPLFIVGSGVRDGAGLDILIQLAQDYSIPIIPSWGVADAFNHESELVLETAGTHGNRSSNVAMQNCDLIFVLGSRLDSHFIGSPPSAFAPQAKKIIVDIDQYELKKFSKLGMEVNLTIHSDATNFITQFKTYAENDSELRQSSIPHKSWVKKIHSFRSDLSDKILRNQTNTLTNPYKFIECLSERANEDAIISCDTGSILAWAMQSFKFSGKQRFIHAFNNTPMGYALPASIAAHIAKPDTQNICLVGDGSFMMNMQELAVISRYKLPATIFVINNGGYSMVRQTQDQWFDSFYFGSGPEDLEFPNYSHIANAFNLNFFEISNNNQILPTLNSVLTKKEAQIIEVKVDIKQQVIPLLKFGSSLEDMEPKLNFKLQKKYGLA